MLMLTLLVCAQAPAAEQAHAWIQDGLRSAPDAVDRSSLSPELQLAYDLALLVPARTSGIEIPAAMREAAAQRALEAWLTGAPGSQSDEVAARLTGVLGAAGAARLAEALRGDEAVPGEDALAVQLKALPLAISADAILSVALDRAVHPSVRGDLAVHLMLAHGRSALDALDPVLQPDEDDRFLRLVFTAWRSMSAPVDALRLERIARESRGAGSQYAIQIWARLERDPARRLELLDLVLAGPGGYAALGLDALADGGPHPGIADRLRGLLRAGTASQRGMALRALARFDSHEAVLEAYRALDGPLTVAATSWWMPVLAQSPLPEAQQAAADWLAAGGIGTGATAQTVTRALAESDVVLPLLGSLLHSPSVPLREKVPLAMTNAARNAEALEFLRELARTGEGLDQQHAVRALGAAGAAQDLAWLEVLARGSDVDVEVRAVAFEALIVSGVGEELMNEWLESIPGQWELREAVVRVAISRGNEEQKSAALAMVRGASPTGDSESDSALRGTAWTALSDRGDPRGFAILAEEWAHLLERLEAEGLDADQDWRDLYERLHAWPELEGIARAGRVLTAPMSARPASAWLANWDPYLTSPEVLWVACALWSSVDEQQTVAWLDALDALPLGDANRIRVRALRAARALQPAVERTSLQQLRGDPVSLRRHPLYLAQAFAPEGARWTLFHDRLAEREVLADARMQPPELARRRLLTLLEGYVEAEVLLRAARFARNEPQGAATALALTTRGMELHPLVPDLALLHAELLSETARGTERRQAWELVMRVAPPGYVQHEIARERLAALED